MRKMKICGNCAHCITKNDKLKRKRYYCTLLTIKRNKEDVNKLVKVSDSCWQFLEGETK